MTDPRILHYAGSSEEDEAHLRLLLRSARKHLADEWIWGSAPEADLVLTDATGDPAMDAAVARAQILDADAPAPAGPFLRRPFHGEAFAALLNAAGRGDANRPDQSSPPASSATNAAGVETAPANVDIEQAGAPSSMQAAPGRASESAPNPERTPATPVAGTRDPASAENVLRPLPYYLPKRVLGGPARIARAGAPALAIDPDSRLFWADGDLPALEPYAREPLRFGDWQRLTDEELEALRKGPAARPFAFLIWMDTYIQSKGVLSRRFDPEGTYKLTRRLELANDYPHALRISAQMTQPRRLDAIARASGVALAEVHDVVNAYEAIGFLEWNRAGAAPPRRT